MKGNPDRLTRIVDAAFDGRAVPEDLSGDAGKHRQFRRLATVFQRGFFEPGSEVLAQAKAVFVPPIRRSLRLFSTRTSMAGAGARLAHGDEAQVVLESEGMTIRLMYTRTTEGWEIIGRLSQPGWSAVTEASWSDCDETGKFALSLNGEDSSFNLVSSGAQISVPAFEELTRRDPSLDS